MPSTSVWALIDAPLDHVARNAARLLPVTDTWEWLLQALLLMSRRPELAVTLLDTWLATNVAPPPPGQGHISRLLAAMEAAAPWLDSPHVLRVATAPFFRS